MNAGRDVSQGCRHTVELSTCSTRWKGRIVAMGERVAAWRTAHIPDRLFMVLLSLLTGVLSGAGAWLLKWLVSHITALLTVDMHTRGVNWWFVGLPVIGILLTGMYQRYVIRQTIYHGTARLNQQISQNRFRLPFKLVFAPIVASSMTLGFGGSAGGEGPIACTGAAIGSNLGKWLRLTREQMGMIVAAGAAAGIAGIFKAPVGGALFAVEVLALPLTTPAVIMVFTAAVTAALTAFVMSGCTMDMAFHAPFPFDWNLWPWMLLLGVFCGLYSAYYSAIMDMMRRWYASMKNPWIKNVLSGLAVGVLILIFPALFGEGYGFMAKLINGADPHFLTSWSPWYGNLSGLSLPAWFPFGTHISGAALPLLVAFGVIAVKAFACASTNSGGGVAGDFAPTLMAGCVAGYVFATALNLLFGLHLPVVYFAFCGMGAVMAGAINAPLMAIFITVEMTDAYSLLLPVSLAAALSWFVASHLRPTA